MAKMDKLRFQIQYLGEQIYEWIYQLYFRRKCINLIGHGFFKSIKIFWQMGQDLLNNNYATYYLILKQKDL